MPIDHETLLGMLTRLKLTAIHDQLDTLLDEAAGRELSLREALGFLCEREVARKDERRIEMATKIAHFPTVRDLDGFDFAAQPSLDRTHAEGGGPGLPADLHRHPLARFRRGSFSGNSRNKRSRKYRQRSPKVAAKPPASRPPDGLGALPATSPPPGKALAGCALRASKRFYSRQPDCAQQLPFRVNCALTLCSRQYPSRPVLGYGSAAVHWCHEERDVLNEPVKVWLPTKLPSKPSRAGYDDEKRRRCCAPPRRSRSRAFT